MLSRPRTTREPVDALKDYNSGPHPVLSFRFKGLEQAETGTGPMETAQIRSGHKIAAQPCKKLRSCQPVDAHTFKILSFAQTRHASVESWRQSSRSSGSRRLASGMVPDEACCLV